MRMCVCVCVCACVCGMQAGLRCGDGWVDGGDEEFVQFQIT